MAFAEDIGDYFDTADGFAEVVQVNAVPVDAIVNLASKDTDEVEDEEPNIVAEFADVDPVEQGDPVIVRGANYAVTNIDLAETGRIVTLYLEDV